jgi:hypothetical protein
MTSNVSGSKQPTEKNHSENGEDDGDSQDGDGAPKDQDKDQRGEDVGVTHRKEKKRPRVDMSNVKLESTEDETIQIVKPSYDKIFKTQEKSAHLKTGDGRWLFDKCQESENQLKRMINYQKIDMIGRIQSEIRKGGTNAEFLRATEENFRALNATCAWCITTIFDIFRQMGWPDPPIGNEAASIIASSEHGRFQDNPGADDLGGDGFDDHDAFANNGVFQEPQYRDDGELVDPPDDGGRVSRGSREQVPQVNQAEAIGQTQRRSQLNRVPDLILNPNNGRLEHVATMGAPTRYQPFTETFSGKEGENIKLFLKQFNVWCKMANIPDDEKGARLIMQLRGDALEALEDLSDTDQDDFDKITSHVQLKYSQKETDYIAAKTAIDKLEFHRFESFSKFMDRLIKLEKTAYPSKKGEARNERIFEDAMRLMPPDFNEAMMRRRVKTLADLMIEGPEEEAIRFKHNKVPRFRRDQETVKAVNEHGVFQEDEDEANVIMRSEVRQGRNPRDQRGQPQQRQQGPVRFQGVQRGQSDAQIRCYNCQQLGHYASRCPQNQAIVPRNPMQGRGQQAMARQQSMRGPRPRDYPRNQRDNDKRTAKCHNCQRMGHYAYECRSRQPQRGGQPQGIQRQVDNMVGRAIQNLLGPFANMNIHRGMQQAPQYQQYQQYGTNPSNLAIPLAPPSVASQSHSGQQQQPQAPSRSNPKDTANVVKEPVMQQTVLSGGDPDDKPVTMKEHKEVLRINKYLANRVFQEEQEENPDPDIIATLQQEEEGLRPVMIPVEKRLAVIPVKVNGKHFRALYDTGASITIASRSIADLADIELEENDQKIQSATGHVATMTQRGTVKLKIGNHTREAELNFAENDQIGEDSPYDMIIGMGTLIDFPPMAIDAKHRKLKILDNVGMELDLRTKGELLREKRNVFATEDKMIPAHAGAAIRVQVESSLGTNTETMTVQAEGTRIEYAECLLNIDKSNRSYIWVLNESNQPIRIRKRMTVGKARNVIGEESKLTNYPEITMAVRDAARKVKEIDPSYKVDYSQCDATPEQVQKLKDLISKYEGQFSKNGYDLGCAKVSPMKIQTTTDIPFKPSIYPIPMSAKEDLQKQIEMMIQSGCIEESDTPWVSPIVMVKKKNGELRPCIDLRKLNEITVPDHFPLPRLSDTLDRVAGKAYLTGLDLNKGFQQLKLDKESSRKCGVITPWGVYQCKTMPFGLRNAPSAFMRMMTKIIKGLEDICIIYMDDFIVMTEVDDYDQHLRDIEKVLQRFKEFNIKANPKKCEFVKRKITFLGHKISKDGIEPDKKNIIKIQEFPVPRNKKEVKRFLGMCSFFRRFIRKYADIASPLVGLTRKDLEWTWTEDHQKAFESLRDLLSSEPILTFPEENKEFHLFVDASNDALGIALMQVKGEKIPGRPIDYSHIAFYSRQFSQSEKKWPIVQKELVSIVEGLRWSKYYTYGRKVIVHTDHRPLIHLIRKKTTHPNLARWLIELQQFGDDSLQIEYIEGERNTVADALSRLEIAIDDMNDSELEDLIKGPFCLDVDDHRERVEAIHSSKTPEESCMLSHVILGGEKTIQELQDEDPQLRRAISCIKNKVRVEDVDDDNVKWYVENGELSDEDVLMFKRPSENGRKPIMVPEAVRKEIFHQFHTIKVGGGHSSVERTLKKMSHYAWKGKHRDTSLWHKECLDCQLRAPKRHKVPLVMTALNRVFESIGVDLCGPLFKTSKGNLHYIVVIDRFSKWIVCIPVPDATALTVARAIYDHVILVYGCPKEMLTDNAKTFTSNFFKEFMTLLGVKKLTCTPYHHDGNAITERSIRDCSNMIAKYLEEAKRSNVIMEWDDLAREVSFCHNVTVHSTIGMSPFNLMFGRDPTFPVDVLLQPKTTRDQPGMREFRESLIKTIETNRQMAAENMKLAMEEVKRQADKHAKASDIQVGELVLYRNYDPRVGMSEKFKNPWLRVYRVKAIQDQHAWITPREDSNVEPKRVHLNQIKRFYCEEERLSQQFKQADPQVSDIPVKIPKRSGAKPSTKQARVNIPPDDPESQEEQRIERRTRGGMQLRTFIRDKEGHTRVAKGTQ